jgi:hypothetical protein
MFNATVGVVRTIAQSDRQNDFLFRRDTRSEKSINGTSATDSRGYSIRTLLLLLFLLQTCINSR